MGGGLNSVEAIGSVVDMKAVWPEFAKTLWIGKDEHVLDYWATEDEYRFGLDKVYAEVPTTDVPSALKDKLKSLKLDQAGQKREKFELLENAKEFEGYLIHPRSFFYEHLKFTDATVHSVYLFNPIAVFPNTESTGSATNLTFEVSSVLPGRLVFETTGGVVSGNATVNQGACAITSIGASRTALMTPNPDGTIDVNLDLDLGFGGIGAPGPDRKFLALTGLSVLSTTNTEVCPTFTLTSTGNQSWDWLRVGEPNLYSVSDDGQTIEGRFTGTAAGIATINTIWKFTAMRE